MSQGLHVEHSIPTSQQPTATRLFDVRSNDVISEHHYRQCMFPRQAAAEAVPQVPDAGICLAGQQHCQQRHCGTHQAA